MSDRLYPPRPIIAASIAVFREGRVLLAARKETADNPVYSLPGGVVELGETLHEAALRELQEEVQVHARILGFVDHVEFIERDEMARVKRHFVVNTFFGEWVAGEATTGPEAPHVMWTDPAATGGFAMTKGLGGILAKAAALYSQHKTR